MIKIELFMFLLGLLFILVLYQKGMFLSSLSKNLSF